MLSIFKASFITALEHSRLIARARRQIFLFATASTVRNASDRDIPFSVVIPIPQETHYQKLVSPVEWSDASVVLQREDTYGNTFGLWQGTIASRQTRECRASCSVLVSPIHISMPGGKTSEQYKNLPSDLLEAYTARNRFVDGNDSRVQKIADTLLPATAPVGKHLKTLYNHVVSKLAYANPIRGLYAFHDALTLESVDCGGFSTLLISLLHARKIPARLVVGFFASKKSYDSMHAWLEALLPNGTWMPLDPSQDHLFRRGRDRTKSGRFGAIGSDHIVTSVGCDIPIPIRGVVHRIDLLQYPVLVEEKEQSLKFDTHVSITQGLV